MNFDRYLTPAAFAGALRPLHAFPTQYVGDRLLETLESTGLLRPRTRVRYPDRVARRLWYERHDARYNMLGELEPDGETWDAVLAFERALHRWQHARAYGPSSHPLDNPSADVQRFVEDPGQVPFEPWLPRRVDVSNSLHATLVDADNIKTFYTTWQLLLAAEVADAGVHFGVDLANEDNARATDRALEAGALIAAPYHIPCGPVRASLGFAEHLAALDAVVWYAQEHARTIASILRPRDAARFLMTAEEGAQVDDAARQLAQQATEQIAGSEAAVVAVVRFLGERWISWDDIGRPLIADAYRAFLRQAMHLLEMGHGRDVDWIRHAVGRVDGRDEPVVDAIWPDWWTGEKARVLRTLRSTFPNAGGSGGAPLHLEDFVDFLAAEGLETFFWRLRSFEEHAFRGVGSRVTGLRSDLQGLAVSIEHVTQALGATEDQLYENFKQLWAHHPTVAAALKSGPVRRLVQNAQMLDDWPTLAAAIEALRAGPDGAVVADLVWAARLRGAVHYAIPVRDQLELERLFVTLMRAAALTFDETRRRVPSLQAT